MKTRLLGVALVVAAMAALPALASGFNIYEQGAKASGQAVAFIARADDPSAAYYNPAAITKLEGTQVSFGFSLVFVGESSIRISDPSPFPTIYVPGNYDMEDNTGLPPHFHITHKFEGTPWAISGSFTAPFGLKTEWDEDFGGRWSARTSDLSVPILSVNLAREIAGGWSASVGLSYAFADLKEFSRNVPLFTVDLPTTGLPVSEGFAFTPIVPPFVTEEPLTSLEGDGDDIGYQMALHFEGESWSFGAVYRSGYDIDLDGDIVFLEDGDVDVSPMIPVWTQNLIDDGLPSETAAGIAAAYAANVQAGLDEQLSPRGAFGTLNLPATYGAGLAYTGLDRWEFEINYAVINWSDFDELVINQENGDKDVIKENWKDTSSWRFGVQYEVADRHIIGAGAYTETNPISSENLRPSIPDGSREGYTLGYGFHGEKWGIDLYYMYISVEDRTVDYSDFVADPSVVHGEYESEVTLAGATAYYKF